MKIIFIFFRKPLRSSWIGWKYEIIRFWWNCLSAGDVEPNLANTLELCPSSPTSDPLSGGSTTTSRRQNISPLRRQRKRVVGESRSPKVSKRTTAPQQPRTREHATGCTPWSCDCRAPSRTIRDTFLGWNLNHLTFLCFFKRLHEYAMMRDSRNQPTKSKWATRDAFFEC